MKKIISGIIAGAMFLQCGAFADNIADLKEVFQKQYTNVTLDFSGKLTLDKPLDILGTLNNANEDEAMMAGVFGNAIDYQKAAESLFGTTEDVQLKLDSSDDYKKINMSMSGNAHLPLEVNENLKITTDASYGIWLTLDLANPDNISYQMTLKSPFSKKYIKADIAKIMKEEGAQIPDLTSIDLKEMQQKSTDIIGELIKRDAEVTKDGNKYIVKFNNSGFINFMEDYFKAILDMAKEMSKGTIDDEMFVMPEEVKQISEKLKEIKILGDKGMTIELTTNPNGIENMNITCDFEMNVYDIIQKITDEIPEGITRDISDVDFTLELDYKYSELGTTTVVFPELNEKNSFSLNDLLETDNTYEPYEEEYYETTVSGYLINGTPNMPYLNLREIIDDYAWECGGYDWGYFLDGASELSWSDGTATFTDSKGTLKIDTLLFDSKAGEAYLDGTKVNLSEQPYKHIIIKDNTTYISPELANKIFGIEVSGYNISFNEFETPMWAYVDYLYPNPNYNAE